MAASKRIVGLGLSSVGLLLGCLCIGRSLEAALNKNPPKEQREIITAGLLMGLPVTAGALSMLRSLERDRKLAHSQRLQALFYKALKANDGKINAIQLAMLAEVSLAEAQHCLNSWAGPMNADFDIDEAGVVVYCFNV